MSWQIFKDNILRYANNPDVLQDVDTVAKVWATEYDACMKRGGDLIHKIALKEGNVEAMTQLFKSALQKGLSTTQPYDLVGEMGNGVKAYWGTAILNNFPIPIIPAPGSTVNTSVVSNKVTIAGQWTPAVSIPNIPQPTEEQLYAKIDFEKAKIDKNDPKVKKIIKFDVVEFEQELSKTPASSEFIGDVFPTEYKEETIFEDSELANGQLDTTTADTLNEALLEQEIIPNPPPAEDIKNGYSTLDGLLQLADKWARSLGKSPRLKYENLKSSYVKGIHGLCAMGVKSVVCAMLGLKELGKLTGNANDFSFRAGASQSFALAINGKKYYNNKIKIDVPYKQVKNKAGDIVSVPNWMGCYVGDSSQWRVGDILALDYKVKQYGHIQIWTGFSWQSDYKQSGVNGLANANPDTLALWRLNDNGAAALASYSSRENKNI